MDEKIILPKDFIFGVSTSAAQIEGGALQDGKTPSIWDTYSHVPGNIRDNTTTDITCDSYNRFPRDLALLRFLGVDSYRMSIAWSRVLPNGVGQLNQKGVDYYKYVFERLLGAGIKPNVTLYHWDLPQALQDKGGFANRDVIDWFGEYADKMFSAFGDIVPMWSTVNEPIATYVGYASRWMAPGVDDEKIGNQARHNILVSHGNAVKIFREHNLQSKIGIVIDIWKRHALKDTPEDKALVIDEDENNWKFYVDPVLTGKYSDYILNKLSKDKTLMDIHDGDMQLINQPLDYFGLNIYDITRVSADKKALKKYMKKDAVKLENGKECNSNALYDACMMLTKDYGLKIPIYITENGTSFDGDEPKDKKTGVVNDSYRIEYYRQFLSSLSRAIKDGCDIRGYYVWSFLDNFEWTGGHNVRYGMSSLDKETMEFVPKKSFYFYKNFIEEQKFAKNTKEKEI